MTTLGHFRVWLDAAQRTLSILSSVADDHEPLTRVVADMHSIHRELVQQNDMSGLKAIRNVFFGDISLSIHGQSIDEHDNCGHVSTVLNESIRHFSARPDTHEYNWKKQNAWKKEIDQLLDENATLRAVLASRENQIHNLRQVARGATP